MEETNSKLFNLSYELGKSLLISKQLINEESTPASLEESTDIKFPYLGKFEGLDVQGVGADEETDKIVVYINKMSKKVENALPSSIGGANIKYIKAGSSCFNPDDAKKTTTIGNYYENNGKVACGSSCAPINYKSTGTIGAYILKDGEIYALSNNHVFGGCNHINKGHPIFSPSPVDSNQKNIPKAICFLDGLIPFYSSNPEYLNPMKLDIAYAKIQNSELISTMQGTYYDTPSSPGNPKSGMKVKKVGRTTGLTEGEITSQMSLFQIKYTDSNFSGKVYFTNVWAVSPCKNSENFALPGDSGALVVSENEDLSLGLVFAAGKQTGIGYFIDINRVLDALEFTLLSGIK